MRELTFEAYLDKVLGCWIGKALGGGVGAPYEGIKRRIIHRGFTERLNVGIANDDLDFQIMWLQALEEKGPYLTAQYMADLWKKYCRYPWSEYGYFMKNYNRRIKPPYSGWFNNEFFKNGMGCPIRSEIWAIAYPGMPELAGKAALMDASLDHADNSLWGEYFLSRLESMLFVEKDFMKPLEECIHTLDSSTRLYACLKHIVEMKKAGVSFDESLNFIYRNFSHPDFTNSIQNIAVALLGVMHGDMDLGKTMDVTLSGGYDTDCTCATAGAIVGIILGASAIPDNIKALVDDRYICAIDIKRADNRISTLALDSARVGASMVKHLKTDAIVIRTDTDFAYINWQPPEKTLRIAVEYEGVPAIGINDTCKIRVRICNERDTECVGRLKIEGIKEGWSAVFEDREYVLQKNSSLDIPVSIETGELEYIDQTNLLDAVFIQRSGERTSERFGVAGATPYRLYGPFFNMADWKSDDIWPPCHGENTSLPSIVSMVHNEVLLDKEYIDEKMIRWDPSSYSENLIGTICAKEDVIPLEQSVSIVGECGFILVCDVIFEEDKEAWVVIGNTDAFKIYLNDKLCISKDEHFFWTPINNAFIGSFKKGLNRLMIKLLRRCDSMKFSIGFKEYGGKHYHQTFWLDNLRYKVIR